MGKKYITDSQRADFWDRIAFSNYIQTFVADKADKRARPTVKMWNEAKQMLPEILDYAKPDAMIILGLDMAKRLPKLPSKINYYSIKHPSQFFKYSDWQPGIQSFLSSIKSIE